MTRRIGHLTGASYFFVLALTAGLLVANVVVEPSFAKPGNWPEELAASAPLALLALASTPSILSGGGGIDVSLGALMSLVNVLIVVVLLRNGVDSPALVIPIALTFGLLAGAINGALVGFGRFAPMLATLCSFFVFAGLAGKVGDKPYAAPSNFTSDLGHSVGPIPGALLLFAIPLVVWLVLRRTPYVRNLMIVGGNDLAAYSAGMSVALTRVIAYALGGLFAACAGIALTALVQSATQDVTGFQYMLAALAAVCVGGTPIGGGRGGLTGPFLAGGAIYLLQTLTSGLGVPGTWLQVIYGGLLAVGVIASGRVAMPRTAAT